VRSDRTLSREHALKTWEQNISEKKPQLAVFTVAAFPLLRKRNLRVSDGVHRSTHIFEKGRL
jgi:hypothetical protein